MAKEKSPGLAAVLSFVFPGLGQVYVGKWRGFAFGVGDLYLSARFFGYLADRRGPPPEGWYVVFALIAITIAAVIDAYGCARRHNERFFERCPRCRARNEKGEPQCLICGAALAGSGFSPPPPPPPAARRPLPP